MRFEKWQALGNDYLIVEAAQLPHALDAELVRRTTRGELGAFEQLVDRHRSVVVRVAARIVGTDEAEDVSQDAFLRAFHRLPHFRGDAPFRAWLLRITHNAALDHLSLEPQPFTSSLPHSAVVEDLLTGVHVHCTRYSLSWLRQYMFSLGVQGFRKQIHGRSLCFACAEPYWEGGRREPRHWLPF